jgi:signal transduction histidine kinase
MLIDNLLHNAINYSYDGGCVAVACRQTDRTTACTVIRDHGIGIPADKLPRVFQDYYRTLEATQHNKTSTGLGLAIVRLVAQAVQATVRIESSPSWGTRVTLLMPAVSDDTSSG